ncbi:MAG: glycosyltransferase family 4 protein [Thermoflexibacter sp.]
MAKDFDVRVLVGKPVPISRFDFLLQKIKTKLFKKNLPSQITSYPIAPPQAYEASYLYCPALEAHHNLYLMEECFKTALSYFIETENWKPDLIHAHVTNSAGIVGNFLSKRFDIPIVLTEHTGQFLLHKYSSFLIHDIIKTLREVDTLVAVGNRQRQLIHLHEVQRPIEVVGNVIDTEKFFIASDTLPSSEKFKILTISRTSFEKDLTTFLQSIKHLIGMDSSISVHNLEVNIVLGGSRAVSVAGEDYEQICQDLGIAQFCHFHYIVPREEIVCFYQNCDVFVSSSIVESFGVAVCEALMCGKPIVSTANGGVEDTVNQENGIIVPLQDYQAMAKAILKIKNKEIVFDPQKVRETVVGKYGKEAFKNRLSKIYLDLVNLNQISSTT